MRYRIEFVGGPRCGERQFKESLPDEVTVWHPDSERWPAPVRYLRTEDGRANPWRYRFAGFHDEA